MIKMFGNMTDSKNIILQRLKENHNLFAKYKESQGNTPEDYLEELIKKGIRASKLRII